VSTMVFFSAWYQSILLVSYLFCQYNYYSYLSTGEDRSGTVVKVLCYKSEGRWFDSRWCNGIFHWHNPSNSTMTWGRLSL
jgi:hypothetical protein